MNAAAGDGSGETGREGEQDLGKQWGGVDRWARELGWDEGGDVLNRLESS